MTGLRWAGRPGTRAAGAALASVALGLGLAGCGIPTQAVARSIPAGDVYGLTSKAPPPTTTTTPDYATTINVYFTVTDNQRIAPVQRQVRKATITSILTALLGGTNQNEALEGYQSALTATVRLISADIASGGVATVDFTSAFGRISGILGELAVAQIVFTLKADIPTISSVAFETDGFPIEVETPAGAVPGAVHPTQFQTLVQPAPAG